MKTRNVQNKRLKLRAKTLDELSPPWEGCLCKDAWSCIRFKKAVFRKRLDELQAEIVQREQRGERDVVMVILYEKQDICKRIIALEGSETEALYVRPASLPPGHEPVISGYRVQKKDISSRML